MIYKSAFILLFFSILLFTAECSSVQSCWEITKPENNVKTYENLEYTAFITPALNDENRLARKLIREASVELKLDGSEPIVKRKTDIYTRKNLVGIGLAGGAFRSSKKIVSNAFGSIPIYGGTLYSTRDLWMIYMSFSKGSKNTISTSLYSASIKLYNLNADLLYQYNKTGRFRPVLGAGVILAGMEICGSEKLAHAVGLNAFDSGGSVTYIDGVLQIPESECLSGNGYGIEGVAGFFYLFRRLNVQALLRYQSKVKSGNIDTPTGISYKTTKSVYDTGGWQLYIGLNLILG